MNVQKVFQVVLKFVSTLLVAMNVIVKLDIT